MAKKSAWAPTRLSKVYWPEVRYAKSDLLNYYERISLVLLPYLKDRPLVMKRYPDGIGHESFFQKNVVDEHLPDFVKRATIPAKTIEKNIHYIVCNNQKTLLYMGNMGALELHPWSSRLQHLNKPDFIIFDLDPGEETTFDDVIAAARAVKEVLDERGIAPSFVKTSGKRGLHVYVPVGAKYAYEKVRSFAHQIAEVVVSRYPDLASLEKHPADRKDKIFIDYLRNSFGQTAVAPYSVRATPTATVSTPLEWKEVKKGLDPKEFTIKTLFNRLEERGDIWKYLIRKPALARLRALSQS